MCSHFSSVLFLSIHFLSYTSWISFIVSSPYFFREPKLVLTSSNVFDIIFFLAVLGVAHAEGLAIDWITLNIYFTDSGKKNIGVCSKTGFTCLTLHNEDIDKPRGIALAPRHG